MKDGDLRRLDFALAFGARDGDAAYNAIMDLDSSGDIGFADFIEFAGAFGQPVGKRVSSRTPASRDG